MNYTKFLVILAFVFGISLAVNIDKCNNTIDGSFPSYALTTDINGTLTTTPIFSCLYLSGANYTFNCNGHSISYNNSLNGVGAAVLFNNTNNVTFENCVIDDYEIGLYLNGTTTTTLQDLSIWNSSNYGVYFDSDPNRNNVISLLNVNVYLNKSNSVGLFMDFDNGNISVSSFASLKSNEKGIQMNKGKNNQIRNSVFINASVDTLSNTTFSNNAFYNGTQAIVVNSNNIIENNFFYASVSPSTYTININRENNSIFSNLIDGDQKGGVGILLRYDGNDINSVVENNTINGTSVGIQAYYTTSKFNITNNTVSNNFFYGILIQGEEGLINNNTAFENNVGIGILGIDNSLTDNHIYGSFTHDFVGEHGNVQNTINMTNTIFDSPDGGLINTSKISGQFILPITSNVTISWSSVRTPKTGKVFKNKSIVVGGGNVTINSISWSWDSSEATGFSPRTFAIYKLSDASDKKLGGNLLGNSLTLDTLSDFGILSILYDVPPEESGNGNGGSNLKKLNVTLNSSCNGSIVSVTNFNSGEKISGARIVLSTNKDVKNTLTDSLGIGKINLCDPNMFLSVSASGYTEYDVRLSGISCSCSTEVKECQLTTDCKNPLICKQNKCIFECTSDANCTVGNSCSNNKCVPKSQCTSNTDCSQNQICISSVCKDKPQCQTNIDCTGSNKICSNQKCVECLASSDCGSGKSCVTNVCIQNVVDKKYSIILPQSFKVNVQTTISVLENDLACQKCNVKVIDPSGKTITATTDANGKFIVNPNLAGTYGISLLVNGKEMANSNFVATAPEIVNPSSDNNGLLIAGIVIIIIAIAGIAYFVMNNKNK